MLDELRKHRNAMPFVPYTIYFKDGRQMHVSDTYHVAFGGRGLVVVYQEDADAFRRIKSDDIIKISADAATRRAVTSDDIRWKKTTNRTRP